jgi:hypothetical protein
MAKDTLASREKTFVSALKSMLKAANGKDDKAFQAALAAANEAQKHFNSAVDALAARVESKRQ